METPASSEATPSTQGETSSSVPDQASLLQEIARLREENEKFKRLLEAEKKPSKRSKKAKKFQPRASTGGLHPNAPSGVAPQPTVVTKTPLTPTGNGGLHPNAPSGVAPQPTVVTKTPLTPTGHADLHPNAPSGVAPQPTVVKRIMRTNTPRAPPRNIVLHPNAPSGVAPLPTVINMGTSAPLKPSEIYRSLHPELFAGRPTLTKAPSAPAGCNAIPNFNLPPKPPKGGGNKKKGKIHSFSMDDQSMAAETVVVDLSSTQPEEVEDELYGVVKSDVVGVQYYKGHVSNNEMVTLTREPHNKYDRNAIKVENTGAEQVGHIKREHARLLSHILDTGLAKVEGVIPFGASNKYRMPVHIHLWGQAEKKQTTVAYLKSCGLPVDDLTEESKRAKAKGFGPSSSGGMAAMDYGHVVTSRTIVTPQEMQNELDKMFETLDEGDKTTEAEPCTAICTQMYPHQKQALNWMMCKENKDILPPFWEQRGIRYVNTLTMFQTSGRPRKVPGGILADDMGLGKTLETIALILTNFVDGKPLAYPLPGRCRQSFGSSKKGSSKSVLEKSHASTKKKGQMEDKVSQSFPLPLKASLANKSQDFKASCSSTQDLKSTVTSEVDSDVMTKKEDKDYQPPCDVSAGTASASRRPQRASKRPMRYCDDDDDDGDDSNGLPAKAQRKDPKTTNGPTASTPSETEQKDLTTTNDMTASRPSEMDVTECSSASTPMTEKCEAPIVLIDSDDELPDLPEPTTPAMKKEIKSEPGTDSIPIGCDKAGRTWTSGPRGTLIVCPVSVISNWVDQFDEHVDQHVSLQLMVYYGPNRVKQPGKLKNQDVVITTYSTILWDFKDTKTSPLHKVEWLRVVLDEGHIIRNPAAQQSKAIFELKAQRRWVLTGTPIQNSMKDLWSLINFLRVQPFTERAWWSRTIARPVGRGEKHALGRVSHLMKTMAMRRLKTQQVNGKPLVDLPARNVYLEKITLSEEERQAYDAMQNHGQVIIGRYFKQGTLLHHYGEVLAILMRLRQMCCHPRLVEKAVRKVMENNPDAIFNENPDLTAGGGPRATAAATPGVDEAERGRLIDILLTVLGSGSDEECSICLDSLKEAVITACAHVYCRTCITSVIEAERPFPKCPLCRGELDLNKLIDVPAETKQENRATEAINIDDGEVWQSSAKIDALMKSLTELRASDPTVRSIVVSQFTSLLNLLEIPLSAQGFSFRRLDGTMSADERVEAVRAFSDPSPRAPTIFLLSLKAGGVGINLTAASRVFLMDPAWNPAAEDQCFDRCHRLGQTKDVTITRFVIEDSVEERMLALQDKKRQLMQGAFDKRISPEQRRTNLVGMIKNLINL